ncbi:MAG: class A beta-lactamase-related serine hydrolase, partial [Balneolaceae bacterium]
VALVLRDGQAVVNEAFGKLDVESGIPMSHNALFRMASQTKAIISVAVMMLQEEGELLISDPLGKYLPEFSQTTVAVRRKDPAAHPPDGAGSENPGSGGDEVSEEDMEEDMEQDTERVETRDWVAVPASRPITIRDLLMHTAGISYGYGLAAEAWQEAGIQGWYLADRDEPIREIVRRMASLPFDAHPGERFVYGYANDILGALIEEISGLPLDRFLQERLFDPLEMHETWFFVPEEQAARLATVYSATEDGGIVRAPDPGRSVGQGHYLAGPRTTFSGGAGLVSTAADYARFLQMMLNGGELDGRRILSPRTVELMTVDHLHGVTFRPGLGIGLGFDVVTNPGVRGVPGAVGDFGWGGAYHSTYWVSPQDRLVVVFFTQLIPSHGSDIHGKLRTLLYQSLIDP